MKYIKTQEGLFSRKKVENETSEDRHRRLISDFLRNTNYTINSNMTVNIDGSFTIESSPFKDIRELPFKFNKVDGDFNIGFQQITSLRLGPSEVSGDYNCSGNYLKTLTGAPERVGGSFNVRSRGHLKDSIFCLKTLEGCPKYIGGNLDITGNAVYSFDHFPEHLGGRFYCDRNPIESIWLLFEDKNKIEIFNAYDPIRPPEGIPYKVYSKAYKPTLYLDILELFFENEVDSDLDIIDDKEAYAADIELWYNVLNSDNSKCDIVKFLNRICN